MKFRVRLLFGDGFLNQHIGRLNLRSALRNYFVETQSVDWSKFVCCVIKKIFHLLRKMIRVTRHITIFKLYNNIVFP